MKTSISDEIKKNESRNPIAKQIMKRFYRNLGDLTKTINFETVYEAGCGSGYVTKFLKEKHRKAKIYATDIDEEKLELAKTRASDVDFSFGDIYDTGIENNAYDLVVSSEVLEHLEYPEKALDELVRISKKYVIVSVPNEPLWRLANMARFKFLNVFGNTPGHINHWSKRSFKKFTGNKIKVTEIRTPFPFTILLCEK